MAKITTSQLARMLRILQDLSQAAEKHRSDNSYASTDDVVEILYGTCNRADNLIKELIND